MAQSFFKMNQLKQAHLLNDAADLLLQRHPDVIPIDTVTDTHRDLAAISLAEAGLTDGLYDVAGYVIDIVKQIDSSRSE